MREKVEKKKIMITLTPYVIEGLEELSVNKSKLIERLLREFIEKQIKQ